MRSRIAAIGCLAVALFVGTASADPKVIDTIGLFDTQLRAYTTMESPPTWIPELKVVVQVDAYAAEDVLVYQLKQGKKDVGKPHTCSSNNYVNAPAGSIPGETKNVDLVFFDCRPDEKDGVDKGGKYTLDLSLKQPLAGNEFKNFATLQIDVIEASQGNYETPMKFFIDNMDDKMNLSYMYEDVVKEYGVSDGYYALDAAVGVASGNVTQTDIPSGLAIRTWFKEGDEQLPSTTMSCMYGGKKVDEYDDYSTEYRDYWTYKKKGSDERVLTRWIQKRYRLGLLKFEPPVGFKKFIEMGRNMEQYWLPKNKGEYRCVIMGGGEILKELFFTIGEDGKVVKPACQSKVNVLRNLTLMTTKDTKISTVPYDKKAGAVGFNRVTWDAGCPPVK